MVWFTWSIFHTDKMQQANLLDWLQSLQLNRSFALCDDDFFTSSRWTEIWYKVGVGVLLSVLITIPESDWFCGSEAGLKY